MSVHAATPAIFRPVTARGQLNVLVVVMLLLMTIGLLMMTSASVEIANSQYGDPFFFLKRQVFFTVVALVIALGTLLVPMRFWYSVSGLLMVASYILLGLVLVPGIGHEVNGSSRWINLGFLQSAALRDGQAVHGVLSRGLSRATP
jgi:cell division protein FtsW